MVREILTYPNEILFKDSIDVSIFDESLHSLLDDMYETMIGAKGVGLAAIQVGEAVNVLIINIPNEDGTQDKKDLIEAINPKIVKSSGEQFLEEGCLSVPDFQAIVKRFEDVSIEYFDRFNKKHIIEASGYLSVAWQHELDHLQGSLFVSRLSILDNKKFKKHLKSSK